MRPFLFFFQTTRRPGGYCHINRPILKMWGDVWAIFSWASSSISRSRILFFCTSSPRREGVSFSSVDLYSNLVFYPEKKNENATFSMFIYWIVQTEKTVHYGNFYFFYFFFFFKMHFLSPFQREFFVLFPRSDLFIFNLFQITFFRWP